MKKIKVVFIALLGVVSLSAQNAASSAPQRSFKKDIPAGQPTNVQPPVKKPSPKVEPKRVDMRIKVPRK